MKHIFDLDQKMILILVGVALLLAHNNQTGYGQMSKYLNQHSIKHWEGGVQIPNNRLRLSLEKVPKAVQ